MRTRTSIRAVIGLLAISALVATACGDDGGKAASAGAQSTTTSAAPTPGGVVTFGQYSDPNSLDPAVSFGGGVTGDIEMAAIYDTIVRYDPVTLKYEPQTAESVTSNADYTQWVIKLRPNIKFSDNTPYDAAAVVFGLNRHRGGVPGGLPCADYVVCPKVNSAITSFAFGLVKDIVATDPLTVTVTLKQPWTFFPYALSIQSGMIPSPTALKKACPAADPIAKCSFNTAPVGAGPFVLDSYKAKEAITMVRNPNYWGGPVNLDGMKFVNLGDAGGTKTLEALKSGQLQAAFLREPQTVKAAHAAGLTGVSVKQYAGSILLMNNGLTVNCANGKPESACAGKPDGPTETVTATRSLTVRQAIASSLDPKVFNDRVYNGAGLPGSELYQKDFKWDPGVAGPAYDLVKAKQLVAQAKSDGWNGTVRLIAASDPTATNVGLTAKTLMEAAGIQVSLDTTKDIGGLITQVSVNRDFDLANFGVNVTPDDGGVLLLSTYLSTNPGNRVGFKSAKFDEGVNDALVADTDVKKKAAYKKIAEAVVEGLPFYIYGATEEFIAVGQNVHGVTGGSRSAAYFGKAWIQK
jgi:peptide/nickel transport system substrate-binding protein